MLSDLLAKIVDPGPEEDFEEPLKEGGYTREEREFLEKLKDVRWERNRPWSDPAFISALTAYAGKDPGMFQVAGPDDKEPGR